MKQAIRITVDPECPVGYIQYRQLSGRGSLRVLREPDGSVEVYGSEDGRRYESSGVSVEMDDNDEVAALEIEDVDGSEAIAIARDYARDNDLAFPDDIRAAAASRDPAA
ncbi:MAG TPA: hypothetical protein VFF00_09985 [Candidatus Elarobacter sp.]|nr:hypothetical protein [Dongiaceae bacterium]HZW54356.1 hypothetical protein [Candidatus Elarobacter sp.]